MFYHKENTTKQNPNPNIGGDYLLNVVWNMHTLGHSANGFKHDTQPSGPKVNDTTHYNKFHFPFCSIDFG